MCYKNAKVCKKQVSVLSLPDSARRHRPLTCPTGVSQKCPKSPPNGVYTCVKKKYKNSYCKLVCKKGLVPNRKGAKCLDLKNDRFHCGGVSRTRGK